MDLSQRLAYDDFASPEQMHADAVAVGSNLRIPHEPRLARAAQAALEGDVPSLHFEDFPREVGKRDIRISDAAARIANALYLHLD